ncbi:MAG: Na(+)/H(+) antiporter subunit C [Planctomycetes bacterium]|nr:Na(+)/H(+) antiporter subunit C [Planctomycetota bacterium]NOG53547.1 Na(+)/H(+) antiporter subunit C [Planctomycetota bacterium]
MTLILAVCVAVILAVCIYLMLGRELKEVAMGVFLLSHAAHLSIIAMSRSPVLSGAEGHDLKSAPILGMGSQPVDALPQALILTSIVISFAVMGFLLTLIVLTGRRATTLNVDDLAKEQLPTP